MTKEQILSALALVEDPDFKKDIVSLGMVKNLDFKDKRITFDLELTTPACPFKDTLVRACKNAISLKISSEIETVVNVTSRVRSIIKREGALEGVKNIIAVASGKGGVGKSTVAANLAKTLSGYGAKVGLMDADIYGPSVPALFNLGNVDVKMEKVGERTIMHPIVKEEVKLFSIGFLVKEEEPLVWRGPMLTSILRQFVNDVAWGELDYLIVDLPPGTGDVQISLSQLLNLNAVLMVTTPQKLATLDVRKAIEMFKIQALNIPVVGLVENMSHFQTIDGKSYPIFGKNGVEDLSKQTELPILAKIPILEGQNGEMESDVSSGNEQLKGIYAKLVGEVVKCLSLLNHK